VALPMGLALAAFLRHLCCQRQTFPVSHFHLRFSPFSQIDECDVLSIIISQPIVHGFY